MYRINRDGSGLTLMTPEEGHHEITWSPDGSTFVDRWSQIDVPAQIALKSRADGRTIMPLEAANVDRLTAELDFQPAEVFTVKARDGITDLYGLIYFPPDLDPEAEYPIISHIYPGPQVGSVGTCVELPRRWRRLRARPARLHRDPARSHGDALAVEGLPRQLLR